MACGNTRCGNCNKPCRQEQHIISHAIAGERESIVAHILIHLQNPILYVATILVGLLMFMILIMVAVAFVLAGTAIMGEQYDLAIMATVAIIYAYPDYTGAVYQYNQRNQYIFYCCFHNILQR
jgi:hypothetical protein